MKRSIDDIVRVTDFTPEDQNRILDYACYLLANQTIVDVSKHLLPIGLGADLSLANRSRIRGALGSKAKIQGHPIAAMLLTDIRGSYKDKLLFGNLKQYVLCAAVHFPERADAIEVASRRVRLMAKGNSTWIFERLKECDSELGVIVTALAAIESEILGKANTESNRKRLRRCQELRRPLAWLYGKPIGTSGGSGGTRQPVADKFMQCSEIDSVVLDSELNGRVIETMTRDGTEIEPLPSERYLDVGVQDAPSYQGYVAKLDRDARHATDEIRSRATLAPCSWGLLTENEVAATVQACFKEVEERGSVPHALIIVSLLFGRKPSHLLCLPKRTRHAKPAGEEYWYVSGDKVSLTFHLDMPTFEATAISHRVLPLPLNRIDLVTPSSLATVLKELLKLSSRYRTADSQLAKEIGAAIKSLNGRYSLRLTEPRLAVFMHASLAAKGVDEVMIRRIRGEPLARNIPQHYDGCPNTQTYDCFRHYSEDVLALGGRRERLPKHEYVEQPLGSKLTADPEYVARYFAFWAERLDKLRDNRLNVVHFHNEFALATYSVLSVATGHRPVTWMFENASDYDPVSRELFVADKNSRVDVDCRCIVLPPIAARQLDLYLKHLEVFRKCAGNRSYIAVRAARQALSGDGPLLFRVRQEEHEQDVIDYFNPSLVSDWLSSAWPLDLKWTRHFVCTQARANGLSHEGINAYLGHDGIAPVAFNLFSGLSYASLKRFACRLDEVLASLGVQPLEGLS